MRRGWKKAHGSDRVTMINGDISDWSASLCDILLKPVTNGWQFSWRQARRHDEKTTSHQKLQFSSRWLINDKSEHLGFQKGCSTTTTPNPPCQSIWQKAGFWGRTTKRQAHVDCWCNWDKQKICANPPNREHDTIIKDDDLKMFALPFHQQISN